MPHLKLLTLLLILSQLFLGSLRLVASAVTWSNNQAVSSSLSPPCQPSSSPAISYLFDPNFVMDVKYTNDANQTQIWLYTKNSGYGQKWSWYGNSTKEIKGLNGKCLDSGSGNNGDYLRINTCHEGNNQKWDITADSAIRQNNICISLSGGIKDGSALVMGDCSLSNCSAYWNYNGSSTGSYVGGCVAQALVQVQVVVLVKVHNQVNQLRLLVCLVVGMVIVQLDRITEMVHNQIVEVIPTTKLTTMIVLITFLQKKSSQKMKFSTPNSSFQQLNKTFRWNLENKSTNTLESLKKFCNNLNNLILKKYNQKI